MSGDANLNIVIRPKDQIIVPPVEGGPFDAAAIKHALLFTDGANEKDATTKPADRFVRLVVGKSEMTFQGEPVTRDSLPARLEKVADRAQTALEVAVASDQMT